MKQMPIKINLHGKIVSALYDDKFDIESIESYKENLRTMLNLSQAKEKLGKIKITDENLLPFVLNDSTHELAKLGEDIKRRGVFNPIILTKNKKLLDGNRRFFACKFMVAKLIKQNASHDIVNKVKYVPAYIIQDDLAKSDEEKIIAGVNFTDEHKVKWPRQVRFSFIKNKYNELVKTGMSPIDIFDFFQNTYGYTPGSVKHANKVMQFLDGFKLWRKTNKSTLLKNETSEEYNDKTEIIERDYFIYFEEYYNKTNKGRNAINNAEYYKDLIEVFYQMVSSGEIESIYSVRDLISIAENHKCLEIIKKGNYSGVSLEKAFKFNQNYAYEKKDEDNLLDNQISQFLEILNNLKPENLSKKDSVALEKVKKTIDSIIEGL